MGREAIPKEKCYTLLMGREAIPKEKRYTLLMGREAIPKEHAAFCLGIKNLDSEQ
jgi:hypothetical protein